jgi:Flp pilus assembly protein TadG
MAHQRIRFHSRRAQATLELALALPILLLLFSGMVVFGQLYNNHLLVTNAAREGARAGVTGATSSEIQQVVTQRSPTLDPARLTVTVTPSDGDRAIGEALTVRVQYGVPIYIPVYSMVLPNPFPVGSTVAMRIERLPGT